MTSPVRVGDTVRLITPRLGYEVGALFVVETIDVLQNKVGMRTVKKNHHKYVILQAVEVVSSPEWQLKLL
jgi:hypothetical protein